MGYEEKPEMKKILTPESRKGIISISKFNKETHFILFFSFAIDPHTSLN